MNTPIKINTTTSRILSQAFAILFLLTCSKVLAVDPPETYIKEVINDFDAVDSSEKIPFWPIDENGYSCLAEEGVGYKKSKGLHYTYPTTGHIAPFPKFLFKAPELDLTAADGIMIWIKPVDKSLISLSAASKIKGNERYCLGEGVKVMDAEGNLLDPSTWLVKHGNGQRSIKLEAEREVWLIIPSTVSPDGTNTGWRRDDDSMEGIANLAIWLDKGGELYVDHLCFYQAKPQ